MKICIPYNEILPKKKAHDTYLVNLAQAFAENGHKTALITGKGASLATSHYSISSPIFESVTLPIVRKNNFLNISWNLPFFHATQKEIARRRPNLVWLSVRKQGMYHLKRKVKGVSYVYEAHELCHYPTAPGDAKKTKAERDMLALADHIVVTTNALAAILKEPPYSLTNPISIVPLAVNISRLPPSKNATPKTLGYVGQLYEGQGINLLLQALSLVDGLSLKVVGGKNAEVKHYRQLATSLGLKDRVCFLGFHPPCDIPSLIQDVDVFAAPFSATGRMPYVAHTKLHEYTAWGRAFIAPDLPVVKDHFKQAYLYTPDSLDSLISVLKQLPQMPQPKAMPPFTLAERAKHLVGLIPHVTHKCAT